MKKKTPRKSLFCLCGNPREPRNSICDECCSFMEAELSKSRDNQVFKHDTGKPRLDLIPPAALLEVAKALEYGSRKYAEQTWRQVPDGKRRYLAASLRHINALQRGEAIDHESGLPHLAHAITNLLFILELNTSTKS